jgi:hypothetical protein
MHGLIERITAEPHPLRRSLAAMLLLAASAGCSARTIVKHDEPSVVSEGPERLVVETSAAEGEAIRLQVFRQREQVLEQHFWRVQESAVDPSQGDPARVHGVSRTASRESGDSVGVDSGGAFYLIVAAAFVAFFVVAIPVFYFVVVAQGAVTFLSVTADDERTTVQRIETFRRPSAFVVIEPASGGAPIDLGVQPQDGWILTPEILARLGGRGAEVVVRDGPLSATVTLDTR